MSLSRLPLFVSTCLQPSASGFSAAALHHFVLTEHSSVATSLKAFFFVPWQGLRAPVTFIHCATILFTACAQNGSSSRTIAHRFASLPILFRCKATFSELCFSVLVSHCSDVSLLRCRARQVYHRSENSLTAVSLMSTSSPRQSDSDCTSVRAKRREIEIRSEILVTRMTKA